MGILNITPDSFSGDGILGSEDRLDEKEKERRLVDQALKYCEAGADILDIGGESTRPGSQFVGVEEELERVLPAIRSIAKELPQAVLSVDTYKAKVADKALENGASIVNDVWGLMGDPNMASVIANHDAWVILMHNRSKPENARLVENLGGRYVGMEYKNLVEDIKNELAESIELALRAGVSTEKIIIDPGIGFGKTVEQNLELIDKLNEFTKMGFPVLLAPSRKSFIGYTLNLPPTDRLEGTAASISIGIDRGADMIRVHDVKEMTRVAKMTDAIVRRDRG